MAYFLRYPYLDQALLAQVYAADPMGMALRSLYLLMFGVTLYFVPQIVRRLINRQAELFAAQRANEARHLNELEERVAARTSELRRTNQDLQKALDEVRTLSGLLPICTNCKKIRDDQGYWQGVEDYIRLHSQADFTHGICPDCMAKIYPEVYERVRERLDKPAGPAVDSRPVIPPSRKDDPQ